MGDWNFLTNHARAMLFIAHNPDTRLRDLAAELSITERTAYGIVADLTSGGYVLKERQGRRNRYSIQGHLPLPNTESGLTTGQVLRLLGDAKRARPSRRAGDVAG
jgi:DNA-binding IclR family transcriptional regulator